jgi:hypothetical protein
MTTMNVVTHNSLVEADVDYDAFVVLHNKKRKNRFFSTVIAGLQSIAGILCVAN